MESRSAQLERNHAAVSLHPEHAFGVQPFLFKDAILHVSDETFLFSVGSYICKYDISKKQATFPVTTKGEVTCLTRYATGASNLLAVGLKQEHAVIKVFNQVSGSTKTLSAKFGSGVDLLCFPDAHYLCSFDRNQVLLYWKWESEKVIASLDVKIPISRILVHPKKSNTLSLSGKSYLRMVGMSAEDGHVKESETFLSLKQEKKQHFIDQSWLGNGSYFIAVTKDSVYCFHNLEFTETIVLKNIFHETDNELAPMKTPDDVAILCCATWAKGFVIGGTRGFLGVFSLSAGAQECIGTFWLQVPHSIVYISPQTGDAPMALLVKKDRDEDSIFAGMNTHAPPKRPCWYFYTFPVSQSDLQAAHVSFEPVFPLGTHQDRITRIAAATGRCCFATRSDDDTLKVWTYDASGKYDAELSYAFDQDNAPLSISVHPAGFQIALVFSDRLRICNTNRDTLMPAWEVMLKKPTDACYNHAGDLLGVAAQTSVMLWDVHVPCMINIFGGHLAVINKVIFTDDDKLIVSCGADGCVYGWETTSGVLHRTFEHVSKGTNYQQIIHDVHEEGIVCLTKEEGLMRIVSKQSGCLLGDVKNSSLSCMALSRPTNTLFGGTSNGTIRAYSWPLDPKESTFYAEFAMHSAPIKSLCTSADFTRLFSGCNNGILMCSKLQVPPDVLANPGSSTAAGSALATKFSIYRRAPSVVFDADESKRRGELTKRLGGAPLTIVSHGNEFVLMPKVTLQEKLTEIKELHEGMENLRNETDYTMAQKDQEIGERVKQLENERKRDKSASQERYDTIVGKLADAHKSFEEQCRSQALDFEEKMKELDDGYESRLSKEYEKQSRLLHEVQSMRESHMKEMEAQKAHYESEITSLRTVQEKAMSEWRNEYDKVCNLLKSDGLKFEEALRQQEEEYELEIQELVADKRAALQAENQRSTSAMKDSVSMKNNIILMQKQLRDKEDDLKTMHKKCDDVQKRLDDMTTMFHKMQQQQKERDDVIKIKDETIAQLREQQKHLESFRFVLFHKVRALEEERDPMEDQVNSLRQSVQEMYSEVVKELRSKQQLEQNLAEKTVKTTSLMQENKFRTEQHVQMKKDFNAIFSDVMELTLLDKSTDCSKHIRQIIRKFEGKVKALNQDEVKEDNSVGLPLITEEVMRQRDILLKKSKSIADANLLLNKERAADGRRMLNENSALISELNTLRCEKKSYQKRVKVLELQQKNNEHSASPKSSVIRKPIVDTPYMKRKKGALEQVYRLESKRLENSLPPRALRADREFSRPEYVKKQPGSLSLTDMPLETHGAAEDDIYTGGPINPENSIPKMKPQTSLARK